MIEPRAPGAEPLTAAPASTSDRRIALAVAAASMAVFLALVPFARVPLPRMEPFIPLYQSALVISDLVTVALLFAQYRMSRSRALLLLACGYLLTALLTIAHTLTFPGLFSTGGWLGAGAQSTVWLYIFWHAAFPLFVIAYAASRDAPAASAAPWLAGTLVLASLLVAAATAGHALLPEIMDGNRYRPAYHPAIGATWVCSAAALLVLWRSRRRSVLDLWLMVVMCVWIADIGLAAVFNAGRFDLGFYAGRAYGLAAATFVLVALLVENSSLYGRLGLESQRRAAERVEGLEAELRVQDERMRAAVDAVPALISYVDRDLRYQLNNKAYEDWFGHRREDIRGKHMREVLGEASFELLRPHLESALAGVPATFELRSPYADGGQRDIRASYIPDRAQDGSVRGIFVLVLDITQSKQAEAALRDADRRKDEFLATLAHELRNPLAPIASATQLLRLPGASPEAKAGALEILQRQVSHVTRLLDDLLDLARISRGRIELQRHPAELAPIVRDAVEVSRPHLDAGGHVLAVDLPAEPIRVLADPARLTQVVANLLNNAARYTPHGGRVAVSVRVEGAHVALSVRDNGIGIDAQALPRLFDLFSQIEKRRPQMRGGLGLGLALARSIVELHEGTLEARSEGAGRGAEFVVRLRVLEGAGPAEATAAPRARALSLRVLVVDDNRDAADSLAALLRTRGAEVKVAYDGVSALAAFDAQRPQIVLLDIGMPDMDGYEVARRLRERSGERRPPIVALTGWGQEADRQRTREAGFDHHLVKPADLAALEELLGTLR